MRKCMTIAAVVVLACVSGVQADTFDAGGPNEFTIDFVPISGDASSANGTNISQFSPGDSGYKTFTDPGNDYRMGTFEITNDQWDKFVDSLGVAVTGAPSNAYGESPYWTGTNVPTNRVSWYEAAQFVNWLNTDAGHQAAYRFTGTQGQSDYALGTWSEAEADNGTNLYRHKDAFYYMPTEDEWVKAAFWNGTSLQAYATPDDSLPLEDVEANYDYESGAQPWDVGNGSQELNGTFDMMGNVWEWMESPYSDPNYGTDSLRGLRGGSYTTDDGTIASSYRYNKYPYYEYNSFGFRVASVPEPCSLMLLSLGGLALTRRRR